jgi:sigma-B regulation protein RsbU (phosphoserine phosphatase)
MEPAKEVGGDFYDFALLDGDRLAVMIGDASGKGVSAAMFIAMGRSILRSAIVRGASPAQALAVANSTLAVENHTMMFATVFVAILDLRTGWLTYASAGHNPPYIMTQAGTISMLGGMAGIALGIVEDCIYDDEEQLVHPGSSLVLFTDGVTEANAPDKSMFEEERLEAALAGLTKVGPEATVAAILAAVQQFAAGEEQADDITVLSARYLGPVQTPTAGGVLVTQDATGQEIA